MYCDTTIEALERAEVEPRFILNAGEEAHRSFRASQPVRSSCARLTCLPPRSGATGGLVD